MEQERLAKLKDDTQFQSAPIHLHFPDVEKTPELDARVKTKLVVEPIKSKE